MVLGQRLWRLLVILSVAVASGASAAQGTSAPDLQAVVAWSSQRYQAMEQLAFLSLRTQAALQVAAGASDRSDLSEEELASINEVLADLQASRALLNDRFEALPAPPQLEDGDLARRLSEGVPIVEEAWASGLAQYDAVIDWLEAFRNGDDPPAEELQLVLVNSQITYLEATVALFEATGSEDYTNPATLDALQRTATHWAQRMVLVLYRADLTGEWTERLAADAETEFDVVRQAVEFTTSEIDLRAANSVAALDQAISSDPTLTSAHRAYRDKVAEIMGTYDVVAPAGESLIVALDEFSASYSIAESRMQRMAFIEVFLARVSESSTRLNEARSRRNQLTREAASLYNEL